MQAYYLIKKKLQYSDTGPTKSSCYLYNAQRLAGFSTHPGVFQWTETGAAGCLGARAASRAGQEGYGPACAGVITPPPTSAAVSALGRTHRASGVATGNAVVGMYSLIIKSNLYSTVRH